jgi:hypothetical protein
MHMCITTQIGSSLPDSSLLPGHLYILDCNYNIVGIIKLYLFLKLLNFHHKELISESPSELFK